MFHLLTSKFWSDCTWEVVFQVMGVECKVLLYKSWTEVVTVIITFLPSKRYVFVSCFSNSIYQSLGLQSFDIFVVSSKIDKSVWQIACFSHLDTRVEILSCCWIICEVSWKSFCCKCRVLTSWIADWCKSRKRFVLVWITCCNYYRTISTHAMTDYRLHSFLYWEVGLDDLRQLLGNVCIHVEVFRPRFCCGITIESSTVAYFPIILNIYWLIIFNISRWSIRKNNC